MSGYAINDEILLATDIEAAKESTRLDAKRKARKERKVEKRRASATEAPQGGRPTSGDCETRDAPIEFERKEKRNEHHRID